MYKLCRFFAIFGTKSFQNTIIIALFDKLKKCFRLIIKCLRFEKHKSNVREQEKRARPAEISV